MVQFSLTLVGLLVTTAHAALQTYNADAATLHLWHFEETALPCVDAVATGTNLNYLINGAALASAAYSNSAVNFSNSLSFGTVATPGAVIFPTGSGNVGTAIPFIFAGASGAFTFEALVQVRFNPTNFVRSQPCQLMNGDANSTGTRVFQFRLDPVGFAGGGGDTNLVRIEFINGITTAAMVPLPVNGPDALVSNGWYHIAVTYNGTANTTSNLLFYWTLLDTNRTAANCIYGANLTSALPGTSTAITIFSIGNSARNPSGGTGAAVANFLGKIDEVRISSVARGSNDFIFSADTDGDGLPDAWELLFFNSLTNGAAGDFDGDGFSNLQEFQAGSNPTNILSTPLDTDADGLPDVWELLYFGSLGQGAADDADGDGYTNLQEFQAGTNPNNALSNPGDTDADGLPDAWELLYFGSLAQTASGDFDGDGYSNLQEYQAGTLPNNSSSFPSLPKSTYIPVDDGNPNTSESGYAGASGINTIAFIRSGLLTVSNQQFMTYYYRHATNASDTNNNNIVVARRSLLAAAAGTNIWEIFHVPYTAVDITDGHDVISSGIDGNGFMHMSWGMHGNNFLYAKSTTPVTGTNAIVFGPATTMTGAEGNVTYPQFLTMPNGDLLFIFREGSSGAGDTYINRYDRSTQTWTNQQYSAGQKPFVKGTGWTPVDYNCYPNMTCLDAAGNLFFIWTWRDTSAYESNHDFNFAKSTNGGKTWLRSSGQPYALPISATGENGDTNTTAERVLTIPQNSSIINQAGMCLDQSNQPVVATWWAAGTATNNFRRQYMVFFRQTNGWSVRQISNRTNDPVGTIQLDGVVRDLGRPVVVTDRQNRVIVLYRDNFGSNGLTIVHSQPFAADTNRLLWTTFDLTTANLGVYEPVIDNERWARDNVLDILYQPSTGNGYTPPANTASPMAVLEWDAAAYFAHQPAQQLAFVNAAKDAVVSFATQIGWSYRLWATTNLNAWEAISTVSGNGSVQQIVHQNGGVGPQRYWRLEIKEGGFAP